MAGKGSKQATLEGLHAGLKERVQKRRMGETAKGRDGTAQGKDKKKVIAKGRGQKSLRKGFKNGLKRVTPLRVKVKGRWSKNKQ